MKKNEYLFVLYLNDKNKYIEIMFIIQFKSKIKGMDHWGQMLALLQ
jgi:hypothetical protein